MPEKSRGRGYLTTNLWEITYPVCDSVITHFLMPRSGRVQHLPPRRSKVSPWFVSSVNLAVLRATWSLLVKSGCRDVVVDGMPLGRWFVHLVVFKCKRSCLSFLFDHLLLFRGLFANIAKSCLDTLSLSLYIWHLHFPPKMKRV